MRRYIKLLTIIENTVMAITLTVMLSLTFANVLVRKFTTLQFAFTDELTCALFILLVLLGAAALAREGGHIGLTLFVDFVPAQFQKYVKLFSTLVACGFCACLFYYGVRMVISEMATGMKTAALMLPEWIFGSFIPIGAFFMFLEFLNYSILAFLPSKTGAGEKGGGR